MFPIFMEMQLLYVKYQLLYRHFSMFQYCFLCTTGYTLNIYFEITYSQHSFIQMSVPMIWLGTVTVSQGITVIPVVVQVSLYAALPDGIHKIKPS